MKEPLGMASARSKACRTSAFRTWNKSVQCKQNFKAEEIRITKCLQLSNVKFVPVSSHSIFQECCKTKDVVY